MSQMIQDYCPIPSKKLRILLPSESSENEELNLSPSFDETYQNLMREEMVAICRKQYNSICDENITNNMAEFLKKCTDLQMWIKTVLGQKKNESLCRCDTYLQRMSQSRQLLQSSRFVNIKILGSVLMSKEPQHQETVTIAIDSIKNQWQSRDLFSDLTMCHVLADINEDIADLLAWLNYVREKLNFGIGSSDRKLDRELIEDILRDFELHNEICLSVIKVIHELQELSPPSVYYSQILMAKSSMDSVEGDIYKQWLNAIEYKLRFDEQSKEDNHLAYGEHVVIGQESGFESELSPIYNARKFSQPNNRQAMRYISSGDDRSECTTELPSDSQSAEISIDIGHLSSSTLNLSSGSMQESSQVNFVENDNSSLPKRVIRRKKRRSKRRTATNQYNLSTEESESCCKFTEKGSLKRRITESNNHQVHDLEINSVQGLNYLQIADAAERLIRRNSILAEYVALETPKESEIEDLLDANKSIFNDIDVDKNWDYYQASMYSNEEGDSQMIEDDKIKDWEPELDTDGAEAIVDIVDESPRMIDKRLSLLTSGYETTMESDPTICSKSLICVLQFTTSHYQDISKRLSTTVEHSDPDMSLSGDCLLKITARCKTEAHMHLRLIRQIIDYDPCPITHNTTLIDNLKYMEARWERIKDRCTVKQLNLLEAKIATFDNYQDVDDLKSSIDRLQGLMSMASDVKNSIDRSRQDNGILWHRSVLIDEALSHLKKARCAELEVLLRCLACVAQSKCTRRLFQCGLQLTKEDTTNGDVDAREIYEKFEQCIISLKKCIDDVHMVSSSKCCTDLSMTIDQEIRSWKKLCDRARNNMPPLPMITAEEIVSLQGTNGTTIDTSLRCRLLRHLPVHMAIIVVVALIGWWYNQSSSSDCNSLLSTDWMRLFYRSNDQLEPH